MTKLRRAIAAGMMRKAMLYLREAELERERSYPGSYGSELAKLHVAAGELYVEIAKALGNVR